MSIRIALVLCCTAAIAWSESVGAYLTQGGRHTRGIDLNLGMLTGVPLGSTRAESRLGTRFGLSIEMPTFNLGGIAVPSNLALLYSTKAVAIESRRFTYSLAQAQLLLHYPGYARFTYLEPGFILSPNYTLDLIQSGFGGNVPSGKSLQNRFSMDIGPALLITLPVVQARVYYTLNWITQIETSNLTVSAFGVDMLLPLQFKRTPE